MQKTLPFNSINAGTSKLGIPRNGPPELVAALDIGTANITCIIAQTEGDHLKICSVVTEPTRGMERGEVTDIGEVGEAVAAAITRAQEAASVSYDTFFVGIGSARARGHNSRSSVTIQRENHEITQKDIQQALRASSSIGLPSDHQILDSVPQAFCLDNTQNVRNPLGMTCRSLEAEVFLVTDAVPGIRNMTSILRSAGCRTEGILFEPLATAEAVLTADDRKLGVVSVDIGAGTMDVSMFYRGGPRFVKVLPVGGEHIIRDVAVGLSTTIEGAQHAVHKHGAACDIDLDPKEAIEVPTAGSPTSHRAVLAELSYIIECRIEEMFDIVRRELHREGLLNSIGGGVVVSGGVAHLKGITKKAEQVLGTTARIGRPKLYIDDPALADDPAYATAVGLLVYGLQIRRKVSIGSKKSIAGKASRLWKSLKEYF